MDRKDFLKLPMEERRKILKEQAEKFARENPDCPTEKRVRKENKRNMFTFGEFID